MTGVSDYLYLAIWLAVAITLSFGLVYAWNRLQKWDSQWPRSPK